jgi:Beta-glucosidase-related glycosidases
MQNTKRLILIGSVALLTPQLMPNMQAASAPSYVTVAGKKFADLNKNGKLDVYEDTRLPLDTRLNNIVSQMTDEEKASFLIGIGMPGFNGITPIVGYVETGKVPGAAGGTFPIERLGIPTVTVADGPAGLRIAPKRSNTDKTFYCTAFPVGTALASTWNEELVKSVGKAMGNEVKEYGVDVLLAPALNIHRNPLCGRNFEYYSEDPLVAGKMAAAYVNGIQSNGVGTSIKHFAANNQETNRLGVNEHVSERAMREIYLKGFEIAVKEAQPWTVMSSYNLVNGIYTSARRDLLTDILRKEWGYKGIVMTDWFGGYPSFTSIANPDYVSDVVKQETAGNDLLMPGMKLQKETILKSLKNGTLSRTVVDQNVKRIMRMVFVSPAFADYKYSDTPDLKAHALVSRHAATEAMVLLKNNGQALPFAATSTPVSVFGVTSYNFYAGGTGSGDVNKAYCVSLIEGLTNAGYKLNKEVQDAYTPYTAQKIKEENERCAKEGLLATRQRIQEMSGGKDFYEKAADNSVIAFITLGRSSGEGVDRGIEGNFNLASDEIEMINNVADAFHANGKKVVVILNVGGVIETASWKDKADAILLAWQVGQEGGNAVADVLSGKANPSGKLPMTFPVNYTDHASSKNWEINTNVSWMGTNDPKLQEVTYCEGIYVGYRYFNTFGVKPSYEFGYGLSYSNFSVSGMQLSSKMFTNNITVTVDVKNTGKVAGKEVVQLYLSAPAKKLDKPTEELKAFAKTKLLQPGETQKVTLTIKAKDLASFDSNASAWVAEAGTYKVLIGTSSLDIRQTGSFTLAADRVVEKTHPAFAADVKFNDLKK